MPVTPMCYHQSVFLVDDDLETLSAYQEMLTLEGFKVRCFSSAEELLAQIPSDVHGCILMDIRMPGMSGLELQQELQRREVGLPMVVISAHGDIPMCVQAMRGGAIEFLEKPCRGRDLIRAVEGALAADRERAEARLCRREFLQRLETLSSGELDVLRLLAAGRSNPEIAAELDISLRTVQFRRTSMLRKMGTATKSALMRQIFAAGWSPLESPPAPA
jgi:FixJ family two-component response regulator